MHLPSGIVLWLVLLALTGCANTRVQVRDQGTGVAVVYAQAVVIANGHEQVVDEADAGGWLALRLPRDPQAVIAIRAQGFLQWSKPVPWFAGQAQPMLVELAPLWLDEFLKTGLKPSQIVEPKGCNCHHQR
jgi:hypothetical protein